MVFEEFPHANYQSLIFYTGTTAKKAIDKEKIKYARGTMKNALLC